MTFLGIGPGELFLILIIALVVVGPERLPGFARQLGKWIVGLRNWIQSSPDAQLLLRARDELEEELRTIRADLVQEMQTVRDEMQSVRDEMLQATREATLDAARQIDEVTVAAREATDELQQAAQAAEDQVAQHVEEAAHDAVAEATAEIERAADEAIADVAQATADPAVASTPELATSGFEHPSGLKVAGPAQTMNGQTVARSSRPGAPQEQAEQPAAGDRADEHSQAARAEIDTLKQQLTSVNDELRELRTLVQALRDELHPASASANDAARSSHPLP
jgi:sec-independent protein translocase protein TatB